MPITKMAIAPTEQINLKPKLRYHIAVSQCFFIEEKVILLFTCWVVLDIARWCCDWAKVMAGLHRGSKALVRVEIANQRVLVFEKEFNVVNELFRLNRLFHKYICMYPVKVLL